MPTWTETQDFPSGICITGCEITAMNAGGNRNSPYSFKQEIQVFSGQILEASVQFKNHDAETGSRLEAFFLSLRGQAGVFRFGDPFHSMPMGAGKGLPTVATATAAGEQDIVTQGWIPNVQNQLKTGDYFQIGTKLYRSLKDVHSDANGEATITAWPDVREALAGGEEIKIRNPRGLWRLASESVTYSRIVPGQRHRTGMSIIEAL